MDFTCQEHRLRRSTAHFDCQRKLHVGDTSLDAYYARLVGFEFYNVTDLPSPPESCLNS